MIRRDVSLTIALCASLVLHALLLGSAAEVFVRQVGGRIFFPGWPRQQELAALLVDQPIDVAPIDPMDRLGESAGTGNAINSTPGDEPMQAHKAEQTQSFLSLDPEGFGKVGQEPVESALPIGHAGSSGSGAEQLARPQAAMPESFGMSATGGDFAMPTIEASTARDPSPGQESAESAAAAAAAPASPGAEASADPAPLGTSESDPVATVGSADFRPGRTDVQLGRGHKLVRPRLSLAGRADLLTLAAPVVVLKIRIDQTGKVTHVAVVRSSGSNEVDQPCKLAAYEWWFEPLKDASGKPIKDEILFAIRFI